MSVDSCAGVRDFGIEMDCKDMGVLGKKNGMLEEGGC